AMLSYLAVGRLLGGRARPEELMKLSRGLPNNPTTEMELALWGLTKHIRADAASRQVLTSRTDVELAEAYRVGQLPAVLQTGLSAFLDRYGFRSVGEIDLGVARWSEDPTHLLGVISNYLLLGDDALAPDAQFRRGAREAEETTTALLGRLRGLRRPLLRFLLGRARALMGSRELPKYMLVRNVFT